MLKQLTLFCAFMAIYLYGTAQNFNEKNGYLHFPTIADYEYFADNPDQRGNLLATSDNSPTLVTLSKMNFKSYADDKDVPDFLQKILNQDNIVGIGSYLVKIDFLNNRALIIPAKNTDAYAHLQSGNTQAAGMMEFDMEAGNALEIMEMGEKDESALLRYKELIVKDALPAMAAEKNVNTLLPVQSGPQYLGDDGLSLGAAIPAVPGIWACRNPNGRELKTWPQWGTERKDETCKDLNKIAVLHADLKLVYQKAVIYFSLIGKEKCRQRCLFGGNPQTAQEVSVFMYLNGKVRYQRCGWSERANSRFEDFYWTNDKSWRPFESSRRLERYDFTINFRQAENINQPTNFGDLNIKDGY